MNLGIYLHFPYCIQRCPYCDFATYQKDTILPQESYIELLLKEIEHHSVAFSPQKLHSIYFGGGTPSLMQPKTILTILQHIEKKGFSITDQTEVTIEINPGTVNKEKLKELQDAGVNRFSVGAQTFRDDALKRIGREHSARQTLDLLDDLASHQVNFSVDVLFALPSQTIDELKMDLEQTLQFSPPHISPYCLTLKDTNPLTPHQPNESHQAEMFGLVQSTLVEYGYEDYELSNFARPGFRSRHNMLYWSDQNYWGIGLSSHSYFADQMNWGIRFWNPRSIKEYESFISNLNPAAPWDNLPSNHFEKLSEADSLTDFCHTALRLSDGIHLDMLRKKFGETRKTQVVERALTLGGLIEAREHSIKLTAKGRVLSNKVFETLHFLS